MTGFKFRDSTSLSCQPGDFLNRSLPWLDEEVQRKNESDQKLCQIGMTDNRCNAMNELEITK